MECGLIGPAPDIVAAVLDHTPMAVTIAVLALEWMSQDHYTESILDDQTIDPQFKKLLKHHWEEELQHARIDELLLLSMAGESSPEEIQAAVDGFFDIGGFLDGGLKHQAALDLASFQRAARRDLSEAEQAEFLAGQHQALRWTFLGTTMRNANFLGVLAVLDERARRRVEEAASVFAINRGPQGRYPLRVRDGPDRPAQQTAADMSAFVAKRPKKRTGCLRPKAEHGAAA